MRLYSAHSSKCTKNKTLSPRRFLPKQTEIDDLWKTSNVRKNLRPLQKSLSSRQNRQPRNVGGESRVFANELSQSSSLMTSSATADMPLHISRPPRVTPQSKFQATLERDMIETLPALRDLEDILKQARVLAHELEENTTDASSLTTVSSTGSNNAPASTDVRVTWDELPATVIRQGATSSPFSGIEEFNWPSSKPPKVQQPSASSSLELISWPVDKISDGLLESNIESPTKSCIVEPATTFTNYSAIRANLRKVIGSRASPGKVKLKTLDFPSHHAIPTDNGIIHQSHQIPNQDLSKGISIDFHANGTANDAATSMVFNRNPVDTYPTKSKQGHIDSVFRTSPTKATQGLQHLSKQWHTVDEPSPSIETATVPTDTFNLLSQETSDQGVGHNSSKESNVETTIKNPNNIVYEHKTADAEMKIEQEPQRDPKLAKYFRMIKMGLPVGAVKNAMKMDGHDPSILDSDKSSHKQQRLTASTPPSIGHTVRYFRIHWEANVDASSNTVWAMSKCDPDVVNIEVDQAEVAKLFRCELQSHTPSTKDTEHTCVKVIDSKRANNGGIALARIKLTYSEIAQAIDHFDENAITSEHIRGIMNFLPTKDERTKLRSYLMQPGSSTTLLCECEKFMVAMISVEHATRKLSAIQFMQGFTNCLEDLRRDTRLIHRACDEIMGSIRFRKVLGIVLALGNQLNKAGKNGREPVGAISLDSLVKLNQAKAFDRQTTFLNFVISSIRRNKASLIHFKDEMPSIFKVEKMQWSLVMFEMERMEKGIDEIRKIALHYSLIQAGLVSDDACTISSSMMPLNREVELLQTTPVGRFTLNACLRLAVLVSEVDKTKDKAEALFQYFGEATKSSAQPDVVFNTVCSFSRDFDRALDEVIAHEKAATRGKRGVPIVRNATKSFDEGELAPAGHHKSPGGGMMGVLSEIKKKKAKAALGLWRRGKT